MPPVVFFSTLFCPASLAGILSCHITGHYWALVTLISLLYYLGSPQYYTPRELGEQYDIVGGAGAQRDHSGDREGWRSPPSLPTVQIY